MRTDPFLFWGVPQRHLPGATHNFCRLIRLFFCHLGFRNITIFERGWINGSISRSEWTQGMWSWGCFEEGWAHAIPAHPRRATRAERTRLSRKVDAESRRRRLVTVRTRCVHDRVKTAAAASRTIVCPSTAYLSDDILSRSSPEGFHCTYSYYDINIILIKLYFVVPRT